MFIRAPKAARRGFQRVGFTDRVWLVNCRDFSRTRSRRGFTPAIEVRKNTKAQTSKLQLNSNTPTSNKIGGSESRMLKFGASLEVGIWNFLDSFGSALGEDLFCPIRNRL
jgi:hypothetical protein